jgi:hypothetical protein
VGSSVLYILTNRIELQDGSVMAVSTNIQVPSFRRQANVDTAS